LKADPTTRETSVAGVYAAGDAGTPLQSVALAAASGASAGAFLNHALCGEDAQGDASSAGSGVATNRTAERTVGSEVV
jgi:pyruvate/2-oxoglutarate dehydrogenase complex dihydrolipoamide dehydrogenase (E3) component